MTAELDYAFIEKDSQSFSINNGTISEIVYSDPVPRKEQSFSVRFVILSRTLSKVETLLRETCNHHFILATYIPFTVF